MESSLNKFEAIAHSLGQNIATERKKLRLTQKQLSAGICSQSMISNIEKGNYVPNAILLTEICQKLGISVDNSLLSTYYEISEYNGFNKKVELLCNNHQYEELIDYMDSSRIIDTLFRSEDLQTFYYYYGCGTYQITKDSTSALRYLNMALKFTYSNRKENLTGLEVLIFSAINFIETKSSRTKSLKNFEIAMNAISKNKVLMPDKNLSIVFYQYAMALLHQKNFNKSIEILQAGVQWTTEHDSNFMLSDFFFLLTQEYDAIEDTQHARESETNYQVISKIFHQKVNKSI
ncbi:helix-turn-helix transcriptional regulator [Lactiplantibacillus plantarum]|uniref:helix-turn-helix domain-containing protein n=1 Tax=Lactiplantibacillus plantarum TaxID=1590 RepID=UPI00156F262E|nr:helix-turn-helix transcriptional regulator [Lactiplantibacillus plantarum]MBY7656489.1 helix-turn-helix transcriptional regulator [Lactiplantibacillus plantarum]QKK58463.1 helix-turn-helix transcriptional regulator [Lactiplantibacillus plantarum]QSE52160.1 helix-turn-helix transcriptional regulator [Lactiplantibacillus plantarum]